MHITKIETNQKRNLYFQESNPSSKEYKNKLENKVLNVFPEYTYQTFIGFGGAFTDASGLCYNVLPTDKKENLIKDYFSQAGLNYNIGRLPIGSSDFSEKPYSYTSKKDLSDFSIKRDEKNIIPFIKKARIENPLLMFIASPWSPPKFMKLNKSLILGGKLNDQYKQTYADYIVKYIKAYESRGIDISYITIQNEPNATQIWESCLFDSKEEAEFAKDYLYPTFKNNDVKTKIFIWDHNKEKIFQRTKNIMDIIDNKSIIAGVAYHYYTGDHFDNISLTHKVFPDLLLFHTEGCTGHSKPNPEDELNNAEIYAHDIIGDLNHGCNSYIDWNLILNYKGGPNHKLNYCNAPIMLSKDNKEYIKLLPYYYIGHFSKYIKSGAKRIAFSQYTDSLEMTSFKNVDDSITIVLFNRTNLNKEYNLVINADKPEENIVLHDNLDSHAIVTYQILK